MQLVSVLAFPLQLLLIWISKISEIINGKMEHMQNWKYFFLLNISKPFLQTTAHLFVAVLCTTDICCIKDLSIINALDLFFSTDFQSNTVSY